MTTVGYFFVNLKPGATPPGECFLVPIGFLTLSATGHINPSVALAKAGGHLALQNWGRFLRTPSSFPYAHQPQMLEHAALCITHAGLNTALESLANGVPMVAIPITSDQPIVAACVLYTHRRSPSPLTAHSFMSVMLSSLRCSGSWKL